MCRSSRLFEIIQLLRSAPKPIPAHALAAALEVSKRTVYRDIATLQAMRVPIEGEAGIGYVMRRGFDLPPLMFTAEELEAVVVGLALLGRTRDEGLSRAAEGVRRKLAEVVPHGVGVVGEVPLRASSWSAVPSSGVDCGLIRRAIREERMLHFTYQDAAARTTTRTVVPLGLTYWIDGIVLGAWCRLRADLRHFRIDRIGSCVLGDEAGDGEARRLRRDWAASGRGDLPSDPTGHVSGTEPGHRPGPWAGSG